MVEFANSSPNTKETGRRAQADGEFTSASDKTSNGSLKRKGGEGEDGSRKKKKKNKDRSSKSEKSSHRRRHSLSKAARDPRDEASSVDSVDSPREEAVRSPSPVIDFDGLSHPSRGTRERLEESPEQAAARLQKLSGAVRTILECIGEDPDREGLLATPERYAKALLYFTEGYQENVKDIVNNAVFHEGHNELVIVKDIEVFSLCEHHMVPFTGKVIGHAKYCGSRNS
ncbi:GTP cyclohydrolase i [Phlyctema vagabunda]|uniref:GTP cyclohydrolase 1 n=1 Tax=Phlyctema vagabunda TaxID=108571 RepID=A0ABR4PIF1_9HELO